MIYIKHISWGVIFMYAFQLHKHRRKTPLFFYAYVAASSETESFFFLDLPEIIL